MSAPCSFHLRRQVDALLCVHFNGLSWSVAHVPGVQPGDELLCGLPHPGGDLHVITCDAAQPVIYAPRVATAIDCEHLSAEDAQAIADAMVAINTRRNGKLLMSIQRAQALLAAGLSEHGFKLQATSVIGESPAPHDDRGFTPGAPLISHRLAHAETHAAARQPSGSSDGVLPPGPACPLADHPCDAASSLAAVVHQLALCVAALLPVLEKIGQAPQSGPEGIQ